MTRRQQNLVVGAVAIAVAAAGFVLSSRTTAADGDPLAQWLELDRGSASSLRQADPTFEADAARLRQTLETQRDQLASVMGDPQSSDAAILGQVERVIEAHNALERRVARHVVAVRSILTPQQQRQLMDLCAESVRQGGQQRWRHGQQGETDVRGRGNGPGDGRGRFGAGGPGGRQP